DSIQILLQKGIPTKITTMHKDDFLKLIQANHYKHIKIEHVEDCFSLLSLITNNKLIRLRETILSIWEKRKCLNDLSRRLISAAFLGDSIHLDVVQGLRDHLEGKAIISLHSDKDVLEKFDSEEDAKRAIYKAIHQTHSEDFWIPELIK